MLLLPRYRVWVWLVLGAVAQHSSADVSDDDHHCGQAAGCDSDNNNNGDGLAFIQGRARHVSAISNRTQNESLLAAREDPVDNVIVAVDLNQLWLYALPYAIMCGAISYRSVPTALVLAWFGIAVYFQVAAGRDIISGVYAVVQIITTVGFGDFTPSTDLGKISMICIVFSGIVVIAGILSEFVDAVVGYQTSLLKKALARVEEGIKRQDKDHADSAAPQDGLNMVFVSFGLYVFILAAGTVFFATYEPCSCSYGSSMIEGCIPDQCSTTGGQVKTLMDAFYLSVITLSTVGFGDFSSLTRAGRIFSIFWILIGVASMGAFVGVFTAYLHSTKKESRRAAMSVDLFAKYDTDGNNTLDKFEFLRMQLELRGLVESDVLDTIAAQFDLIDKSGDGQISLDEVKDYCRPPKSRFK